MGIHDEDVRHAQKCPACGKYYDPDIDEACPLCEDEKEPECLPPC